MVTCKGHVVVRSMAIVLYACDAIIAVDLQLSGLLIFRDVHDAVHRHTHTPNKCNLSGCELKTQMIFWR